MEDEEGEVGLESSVGVSGSSLSDKLPGEPLVENIGGENNVEESYEEGDGGEIMVEVVGSDVLIDGVCGQEEGYFVSGEVGDLKVHKGEHQEGTGAKATDVTNERDGDKMEASEVGFSGSRGEHKYIATEEVDTSLRESVDFEGAAIRNLSSRGDCVSDDKVLKHGNEEMVFSSSAVAESKSDQTEEAMERTPVVISEDEAMQDKEADNSIANIMTSKLLNCALEAVGEQRNGSAEKEESLPVDDNGAGHDQLRDNSVTTHEAPNLADAAQPVPSEVSDNPNCEGLDNVQIDRMDSVGEAGLDGNPKDGTLKANTVTTSNDGDCAMEAKFVGGKEASAESSGSILKTDAIVSVCQDESQGFIKEFKIMECEPTHGTNFVLYANLECSHDKTWVSEREESVMVHKNDVFSNKPSQPADGGYIVGVQEGNSLNVEIQDDTVENQPKTTPSCLGDREIVKADSDINTNEPFIATSTDEVINDEKVVTSQVEVVGRNGSSEKAEQIESDKETQLLKCVKSADIPAVDASAENMQLSPKAKFSKDEMGDVMVVEGPSDLVVNAEGRFNNVDREFGSPQRKEQEVASVINETSRVPVQMTEMLNNDVDRLVSINLMPNEVSGNAAVSAINHAGVLPEMAEIHVSHANTSLLDGGVDEGTLLGDVAASSNAVSKSREAENSWSRSNGFYISEGNSGTKLVDVEVGKEFDRNCNRGMEVDLREPVGNEEPAFDTNKFKLSHEQTVKFGSCLRSNQSGYLLLPQENEGRFTQSDLVWGKVRSHPWWPGQIFDPADASEKALKYYKKDSYLIAYFGDRTFAWNDASLLKPFRSHFSQTDKQSNSEAFQNAVGCALEEVSRRVELGLACSCMPKNAYSKIESQVVDNTGIREESSRRYGVDQSTSAASFEPNKLLDYVRDLAPCASSLVDRLDLVIARAQLTALCNFKGYRLPTEFPSSGALLEDDAQTEQISDKMVASQRHKRTPKYGSLSRKERSLMELMGERTDFPDAEDEFIAEDQGKSVTSCTGRKRKALVLLADGTGKRLNISNAKLSTPRSQTPKPSFKIGECIRRVASQLTGSTSSPKGNNDEMITDGSPKIRVHSESQGMVVPAESFSVNEMLSQLELVAQDPNKGQKLQNNIRTLFLGFRSSVALNKRGRKRKSEPTIGGSGEEFEFDDVNDSYWTDRIVQNYSQEQLLHDGDYGAGDLQPVPFGAEKSIKSGRKSHSRKRFSSGSYTVEAIELDENIEQRKRESSPAELILNFAETGCVPSEINLNKMFRRFGSLMESETEVDHELGRAKVIFKRGSDAEVALNSAEKFNIFGAVLVNYQIGYSPLVSVKILPVAIPQCQDETLML